MSRVKKLSIFFTGMILVTLSNFSESRGHWLYLGAVGCILIFYYTILELSYLVKKHENDSDILKKANLIVFGVSGILVAASYFFHGKEGILVKIYPVGFTGLVISSIVAIVFIRDQFDNTKPQEGE